MYPLRVHYRSRAAPRRTHLVKRDLEHVGYLLLTSPEPSGHLSCGVCTSGHVNCRLLFAEAGDAHHATRC